MIKAQIQQIPKNPPNLIRASRDLARVGKENKSTPARAPQREAKAICAKRNVVFVTFGYKIVRGRRTRQRSLKAYVLRKTNELSRNDRIPKTITAGVKRKRRIKTDVVLLSRAPRLFGARSGHKLRAWDNDKGTCALSFRKNGRNYLLTNAHVVADLSQGGVAGVVELRDRQTGEYVLVGEVIYGTPIVSGFPVDDDAAAIDANAIKIDAMKTLDSEADIVGFDNFNPNYPDKYFYNVEGRIIECVAPEPVLTPVQIAVDGLVVDYVRFWSLSIVNGAIAPGHSGALVYRNGSNGLIGCGLLFGGAVPNIAFAFPIRRSFQRAFDAL